MPTSPRALSFLVLSVSLLAGCQRSANQCVPGASVACACPSGGTSAQVCAADGTYGACACSGATTDGGSPGAGDGGSLAARDLDILFMIDDSPSMGPKQAALQRSFPAFTSALAQAPGGLPSVHIGFVSSDLGAGSKPLPNGGCPSIGGDRGIFQARSECALKTGSQFVVGDHTGASNNFAGDLANVLSCLTKLGDVGCGYEHQLAATAVALDESITSQNAGFLRATADLAIILLTDEDDCSAPPDTDLFIDDAAFPGTSSSFRCAQAGHLCNGQSPPVAPFTAPLASCQSNPGGRLLPVAQLVDKIRQVKNGPDQKVFVAGIFGWPGDPAAASYGYGHTADGLDYTSGCGGTNGGATFGLRLKQFVDAFGARGAFYNICDADYSLTMKRIGETLAARL